MDETTVWTDFRDALLSLYGDAYSWEDILKAYTIIEDNFFAVLNELDKSNY